MSVRFEASQPDEPHEGSGSVEGEPSRVDESRVGGSHWAELSALVDLAAANRGEMTRLHAERAEICAMAIELVADRVAQRDAGRVKRMPGEFGDDIPLREVVVELSAALRVSDQTIRAWLSDGDQLVRTLPETLEALRGGRIDDRHASAIIDGAVGLAEEHRGAYQEQVLEAADQQTAAGLRETAKIVAARLQPDLVEQQQTRVYEERAVRAFSHRDGGGRLQMDGPAALIFAIFDRATEMAAAIQEAAKRESEEATVTDGASAAHAIECADDPATGSQSDQADVRSRDQVRFDVLTDLLLTGAPTGHGDPDALGAIRGEVQVTVPVLTLAGLDDEPALLAGHGPIDAETARRIAGAASGWDRILTHPTTGLPLAVDRYRPTAEQKRLLKARDRHCRWPGCRRPAKRCDDEHNIPHSEGGETCVCNMCEFCRRHHVLKHASLWQIINCGGGVMEFISPTGRRYRNDAPPVLHHVQPRWSEPFIDDPADPVPF